MGHVNFLRLLRRETLLLFQCVYQFPRKFYHQREPFWISARAELEAFAGQARRVHQPLFSQSHRGWRGKKLLANTFFFSPIFLQLKERRMIRCLRCLRKGKRAFPSLLKRPLPTVDWTALTVDVCRVDCTLAHPDHVRNWNREEQEWRGGRCDQSQSKSTPMNRASSRGFQRRQDSPSERTS